MTGLRHKSFSMRANDLSSASSQSFLHSGLRILWLTTSKD